MRTFVLPILAGLVFVTPVAAEGLLDKLPEDGAFVRFELNMSINMQGLGEKTHNGTLTMSSVGEKDVDGKPGRWLEIKQDVDVEGEPNHITKALIPNERLKAGESPLDHVAKAWLKRGDTEPKEIIDFKGPEAGFLRLFFPGALKDAKKLPEEVIESKLGKLECAGHTGTSTFEAGDQKFEVTYENRLHDKAPFGVVSSRMSFKMFRNGQEATGTMTLRLVEVGKGATSELPAHQ